MRRSDREVTDISELLAIIDACKVCRLALQDNEGLYIVPLNFGYACENGQLTLYFHSAKEGRKIGALVANPAVCFEMDCGHRLIEGENACGYGYSFQSIIGTGTAEFVTNTDEKKKALSLLMKHQTGNDFMFSDADINFVAVFQIKVSEMTGKYHT